MTCLFQGKKKRFSPAAGQSKKSGHSVSKKQKLTVQTVSKKNKAQETETKKQNSAAETLTKGHHPKHPSDVGKKLKKKVTGAGMFHSAWTRGSQRDTEDYRNGYPVSLKKQQHF